MKYRIVVCDRKFRVEQSKFGFFWEFATIGYPEEIFEVDSLHEAKKLVLDTIRVREKEKKFKDKKSWEVVEEFF